MSSEHDVLEVYTDVSGAARWRRKAGNNEIIGSSGESFSSEDAAEAAARRANPDVNEDQIHRL